MALTSTLVGDFSSFLTAVSKAEISLKSFESGSNKVSVSLTKMANGLSGQKIIQDATLMAAAVEKVGGVSMLTERELARVSATASEAAQKMKALGIDVPPGIAKIAAEAKTTTTTLTTMKGVVTSLAGAFGVGFGVAAIASLGRELLSSADALVKMQDKTGISIQGLQKLQIAGDDAGNTIDQITTSVNMMQRRIAGDDASASTALKQLGLDFNAIRAMSPDAQFMAIGDAIRGIKDPAEQVNLAMAIFGRSGAEILPTLKRGFDDLKDSAVGMSDETVKALDKAGDAWTRYWRAAKGFAAETLTSQSRAAEEVQNIVNMSTMTWLDPADWAAMHAPLLTYNADLKAIGVSAAEESAIERTLAIDLAALNATRKIASDELDRQEAATKKLADLEQRAVDESNKLWSEHYIARIVHGGTANELAIAQIQLWERNLKESMRRAGTDTAGVYAQIAATSKEKMAAVGVDFDVWKKSKPALQELADNALKTYTAMTASGVFFREELEKQHKKYLELKDAARGYGDSGVSAAERIEAAEKKKRAAQEEADKKAEIEKTKKANREMGGSTEYDLSTPEGRAQVDPKIKEFLAAGWSLKQATALAFEKAWNVPHNYNDPMFAMKGPRVPGFADGGVVTVGERGPERVRLPFGSQVFPHGSGGVTINNYITQPFGTPDQIARAMSQAMTESLRNKGIRLG